jgi:hypothetical protein
MPHSAVDKVADKVADKVRDEGPLEIQPIQNRRTSVAGSLSLT